jgi:hypothetical protein
LSGGGLLPLLDKKDKKTEKVGKEFGNTKIGCYLCNRKSTETVFFTINHIKHYHYVNSTNWRRRRHRLACVRRKRKYES